MDKNKLREATNQAFDAEFRDKLCNAVQKYILNGGKIGAFYTYGCSCPDGCLELVNCNYPTSREVNKIYPFSLQKHADFQTAFDSGYLGDNLTPERALGLLYRMRFVKEE